MINVSELTVFILSERYRNSTGAEGGGGSGGDDGVAFICRKSVKQINRFHTVTERNDEYSDGYIAGKKKKFPLFQFC